MVLDFNILCNSDEAVFSDEIRKHMFNSLLHMFATSEGHIDETKPLLPRKENVARIL